MYLINYPHLNGRNKSWLDGKSDALEKGLAGFSDSFVDPYYQINPLDQGEAHFNMNCEEYVASEEYVEKKRIFAAIDDGNDDDNDDDNNDDNDGEFLLGAISSSDDSDEENDEEIENN